jgi:hypothetical protein
VIRAQGSPGTKPVWTSFALASALVVACAQPAASPLRSAAISSPSAAGPTSSPELGRDWVEAGVVDPGEGDPTRTTPPYTNPGSLGHPGAYQGGQADLLDVASGPVGLFAVGYLARDIRAEAWSSADGFTWTRSGALAATAGSLANGVAIGESMIAVVGASGADAAVWTSPDGRAWQAVESADLRDPAQLSISTVVPWKDGFVAAGHVGSLVGPIRAAFWVSGDGRTWRRIADSPEFADSRVADLTVRDGSLVAVGAAGDAKRSTGAVTWRSTDPDHWERSATEDPLDGTVMNSVTAGPGGIVAVGSDIDAKHAVAWHSADGLTWTQAPEATSLENHGLRIEMRSVAWTAAGYVAGGHLLFGTQYPAAVVWTSLDGLAWSRANEPASFSQGKIQGIAAGGPGVVAVGSFGSPDFSIPTVWVSPGA